MEEDQNTKSYKNRFHCEPNRLYKQKVYDQSIVFLSQCCEGGMKTNDPYKEPATMYILYYILYIYFLYLQVLTTPYWITSVLRNWNPVQLDHRLGCWWTWGCSVQLVSVVTRLNRQPLIDGILYIRRTLPITTTQPYIQYVQPKQ